MESFFIKNSHFYFCIRKKSSVRNFHNRKIDFLINEEEFVSLLMISDNEFLRRQKKKSFLF